MRLLSQDMVTGSLPCKISVQNIDKDEAEKRDPLVGIIITVKDCCGRFHALDLLRLEVIKGKRFPAKDPLQNPRQPFLTVKVASTQLMGRLVEHHLIL